MSTLNPAHPRRPRRPLTALVLVLTTLLVAAGCAEADQLIDDIEEQTDGSIDVDVDLDDIDLSEIDLNAPDFTIPDIVNDIDIDIDITEAPDIPVIRFPDAITIELPQITSEEVEVTETPEETIYTVSGTVLFDFDRADLRPEALDILEQVLAAMQERGHAGLIEVAGHTDSVGDASYNYDLSVRRATGVALWFRERVPAEQEIGALGYGETQPIAPNTLPDGGDDEVGRAQNRRVEIIVGK
ncbi:MAG: OmpA family protein [Actinomycetota bacterium]